MMIWAGWTLNQRKPISAPMMSAQKIARFGWASFTPAIGDEADQQVGDEAEDEDAAGEAVEAVGQVHRVARARR